MLSKQARVRYTIAWVIPRKYIVFDWFLSSPVACQGVLFSPSFANGKNHTNVIENFWNQAKRVLRKYNRIPKESFPLFLKECEFRFNCGTPKQQLKILKKWADI